MIARQPCRAVQRKTPCFRPREYPSQSLRRKGIRFGDCTKTRHFPSAFLKITLSDGVGVPVSTRWWRSRQMVLLAPQVRERMRGNAGWRWDGDSKGVGRGRGRGGRRAGCGKEMTARGASSPLGAAGAKSGPGSSRGHLAARGSAGHPRPSPVCSGGEVNARKGATWRGKTNLRLIKIQHFKFNPVSAHRVRGESFSRYTGSPFVCRWV